jgi:hypothetical protein
VGADTLVHFEDKLSDEMQVAARMRKNSCIMFFARLSDRLVTLIFFSNTAAKKIRWNTKFCQSFGHRFDDPAE